MKQRKVLIVEDDTLQASFYDLMLQRHADTSNHFAPTIAKLKKHIADGIKDYHLILMDNDLPDGTAHALIPEILKHDPDARIVAMSAFDRGEPAIGFGAKHFLRKPFSMRELTTAFDRHAKPLRG